MPGLPLGPVVASVRAPRAENGGWAWWSLLERPGGDTASERVDSAAAAIAHWLVVPVGDFTDNLFGEVLQRKHSRESTVFVDSAGELVPYAGEFGEGVGELDHAERLALVVDDGVACVGSSLARSCGYYHRRMVTMVLPDIIQGPNGPTVAEPSSALLRELLAGVQSELEAKDIPVEECLAPGFASIRD